MINLCTLSSKSLYEMLISAQGVKSHSCFELPCALACVCRRKAPSPLCTRFPAGWVGSKKAYNREPVLEPLCVCAMRSPPNWRTHSPRQTLQPSPWLPLHSETAGRASEGCSSAVTHCTHKRNISKIRFVREIPACTNAQTPCIVVHPLEVSPQQGKIYPCNRLNVNKIGLRWLKLETN